VVEEGGFLSGFFFGTFCFAPRRQRKKYAESWQDIAVFILPAFSFAAFLVAYKEKQSAPMRTTKQKIYFIDLQLQTG
jgi:hypothetical protein